MASGTLTDRLRETLALFDGGGEPLTTTEVADSLDVGRRSTYGRLETLVEQDRLETKKVGANARVWWRPSTDTSVSPPAWPAATDSPLDDVLDAVAVGIFVLDEDFEVTWINEAAERYFGLPREDVLGHDERTLLDERIATLVDDADTVVARMLARDDTSDTEPFEFRVTAGEDREERWLEHRSTPITTGDYADGRVELYYDITDRKHAEHARQTDRHEFESLVTAVEERTDERDLIDQILAVSPIGIQVFDHTGEITRMNARAREILEIPDDDAESDFLADRTVYDRDGIAVPPDEHPSVRALATGDAVFDWEARIERPDGGQRWVTINAAPSVDAEGAVRRVVTTVEDNTQLEELTRRLERRRDDLQAELEEVFTRIDDAVYALDEELRFEFVTDRAEALLGQTETELLGRTVWEALSVAEDDPLREQFQDALQSQTATSVERYDESLDSWEVLRVSPSESGLTVSVTDITDRKTRERELERYETIVETVRDGVYALDDDGRFVFVNQAFCELVGSERAELLGEHSTLLHSETVDEAASEQVEEILDGERDVGILEVEFETATGETVPVETRFGPCEDRDGRYGRCGVARDISERAQQTRELKRFEQAVESSGHAIYMTDVDGEITYINPRFEEITGYDASEAIGNSPAILNSGHHDDSYYQNLWETVRAGTVWEEEIVDRRADGSLYHAEQTIAPVTDVTGDIDRFVAIQSDISDRKEREAALQDRIRQQQAITDLGTRALEDLDLDTLMADAARLVAETLDNDSTTILELDTDSDALLLRQASEWDEGIDRETTVSSVEDGSQAASTLASDQPVIVQDGHTDSRFGGSDLLGSHDVRSGISTIIGPVDDPWGILGTHDTDPKEISEHDAAFVQSVANVLAAAIDRHTREQEVLHHREQLAALNSLNVALREITGAVIEQSNRAEIEATVCDRLAKSESYSHAWIGEVDTASQTVTLRTEAGVEGSLDDETISVDPDDDRGQGPTGRAFRTGEIQVATHTQYESRSSAAIPIVHEDTVYGVLTVTADRPDAFTGQERVMIGQVGEIVGHAIAAAERKQALLSDELVELDFRIRDVFGSLDASVDLSGTVTVDDTVAVGDGAFLIYGTATPDALDGLTDLVDAQANWESVTVRSGGDTSRFELRVTDSPILSVVGSRGGYLDHAVIADGDLRMTIHLAPATDVRAVISVVEDSYPTAEMVRRKQISRERDGVAPFHRRLVTELTDRQRAALETAYHAGFFEWPRDTSGEQVADSMGIAPPTFHQHLRKAEQKAFDAMFSATQSVPSDGEH